MLNVVVSTYQQGTSGDQNLPKVVLRDECIYIPSLNPFKNTIFILRYLNNLYPVLFFLDQFRHVWIDDGQFAVGADAGGPRVLKLGAFHDLFDQAGQDSISSSGTSKISSSCTCNNMRVLASFFQSGWRADHRQFDDIGSGSLDGRVDRLAFLRWRIM